MSNIEYTTSILLEGLEEEMYFNMENSFFSWHSFLDSAYATFSSSDSLELYDIDNDNEINYYNNLIVNNNIGKKRGRKKKSINGSNRPEHGKLSRDNVKRKIKIHYLKFLRLLINQILYELHCQYKTLKYHQFYPLDHNFSENITKTHLESLKIKSIGDIFKDNTSTKFKREKKSNLYIYNEVIKNNEIKNILDKNYLEFIHHYYNKTKEIDLLDYGINKTITLEPSLESFKDLINKECKGNGSEINNEKYHDKLEKCIKEDFLNDKNYSNKANSIIKKNQNDIINF